MSTQKAYFSITGEFITNMSRDFVREGNWEKGLSLLTENLEGMTTDMAISILKGELLLDGVNSNIQPRDDSQESIDEMDRVLDYMYGHYFKDFDGGYWIPYAYVIGGNQEDMAWAVEYHQSRDYKDLSKKRHMFYARNLTEDKSYTVEIDVDGLNLMCPVICERAKKMPPFWYKGYAPNYTESIIRANIRGRLGRIDPSDYMDDVIEIDEKDQEKDDDTFSLSAYVDERNEQLSVYNLVDDVPSEEEEERLEALEEQRYQQTIQVYRDEILKQADGDLIDVVDKKTKKVYKAPRVPFLYWAAHYNRKLYDKLPEWNVICPLGLKMMNDNCFHSDVIVGAGLDPQKDWKYFDFQDSIVRAFDDMMYELQRTEFNHNLKILAGEGSACGRLVSPDDEIKAGDILVIPHAGPEFQIQAQTAGTVITQVGGPLAHLVKVSREIGIKIAQMDDATTELVMDSKATIDFDEGQITYDLLFADYGDDD